MLSKRNLILTVAVVVCANSVAFAGPNWNEVGDAGPKGSNSQPVTGVGAVTSITGSLAASLSNRAADFEDMYLIDVTNPSIFSATTLGGFANFNAQLWLFGFNELGLLASDDAGAGDFNPFMGNTSNDGTNIEVAIPGLYYLAISGFDNDPVSLSGLMFNQALPLEISGPDGPGGMLPHDDWTGLGEVGSYQIRLTGVSFIVPEPSVAALMFVGMIALVRRRGR